MKIKMTPPSKMDMVLYLIAFVCFAAGAVLWFIDGKILNGCINSVLSIAWLVIIIIEAINYKRSK